MAKIVKVNFKLPDGDVQIGVRADVLSKTMMADYVLAAVHKIFGRQCVWENVEDIENGCRGRVLRRLRPTLYRAETKDVPQTPVVDVDVAIPEAAKRPRTTASVVYFEVHFPGQEPFIAATRVPRLDENGAPWSEQDLCKLAAERFASKCAAAVKSCSKTRAPGDSAVIGKVRISLDVEC